MSLAELDSWHEWMQPSAPASAPEDVAMLGVFSPPSTKKRIRQAEKKRVYNRSWKSRMRTEIKKLLVAVEAEQVDVAKAQFPTTVSVIQRVVKRGIIHKNKGSRLVSRLHLKYKKLTEPEWFAAQEEVVNWKTAYQQKKIAAYEEKKKRREAGETAPVPTKAVEEEDPAPVTVKGIPAKWRRRYGGGVPVPKLKFEKRAPAPTARAPAPEMRTVAGRSLQSTSFTGTKPQHMKKAEEVKTLKILLDDSSFVFGIPNAGIPGNEIVSLRKSMPAGVTTKTIKNTIMRYACEGTEWSVVDPLLKKANLWFFVDEDVHIKDTIGALTKWTKDYAKKETHEILGGVFGGELLDADGVDAVGKLPTKQELMGQLAFALQEAGAARIVRCINQVPTKLARGIKLAKEDDAEEGTVAALAVGGAEVEGQSPLSPDLVEAQAEASDLVELLEDPADVSEYFELTAPMDFDEVDQFPDWELFEPAEGARQLENRPGWFHAQEINAIREKYRLHENDSGSAQVQIAECTVRIAYLTTHMQQNKKDQGSLRGLIRMVNRRRKLLNYLWKEDNAAARKLVEELSIRFRPNVPGVTDKYSQYKRKESKGKIKARKTKEEEGKKVAMAAVGGMEAEVLDDSDDDSMLDDVDDALALLAVGGEEAAVAEAPEEEDDELLATYKEIMQLSIKKETSRGANFPAAKWRELKRKKADLVRGIRAAERAEAEAKKPPAPEGPVHVHTTLPKLFKKGGKICQLTGMVANRKARRVTFSGKRNHKVQEVNLQRKKFWWPEGNRTIKLRLSTRGIRTIRKLGVDAAAKKYNVDLKKYTVNSGPPVRSVNVDKVAALAIMGMAGPRASYFKATPRLATRAPHPKMMRHWKRFKKLNKPADQRKALLRGLTTECIRYGRIETNIVRAKACRKRVDHMVTLAKEGSLHSRRQALGYMYDKQLVHALFEQAPERYADRNGGYTRVLRTGFRRGDNTEMAILELV